MKACNTTEIKKGVKLFEQFCAFQKIHQPGRVKFGQIFTTLGLVLEGRVEHKNMGYDS